MLTTSVTLLEQLRHPGQRAAWDRFVDLYTPLLFAWARRSCPQEADAADLVQDVFAVLVRKLPGFEYDAAKSFRGWLRTVARNQWQAGRRKATVPTADVDPDTVTGPDDEPFWEGEYRRKLVARALALMQAEFQPTTWKACWECAVNGRPAPEVAAELGLRPGAARAAKFRVLARLRAELDGLLD